MKAVDTGEDDIRSLRGLCRSMSGAPSVLTRWDGGNGGCHCLVVLMRCGISSRGVGLVKNIVGVSSLQLSPISKGAAAWQDAGSLGHALF